MFFKDKLFLLIFMYIHLNLYQENISLTMYYTLEKESKLII